MAKSVFSTFSSHNLRWNFTAIGETLFRCVFDWRHTFFIFLEREDKKTAVLSYGFQIFDLCFYPSFLLTSLENNVIIKMRHNRIILTYNGKYFGKKYFLCFLYPLWVQVVSQQSGIILFRCVFDWRHTFLFF